MINDVSLAITLLQSRTQNCHYDIILENLNGAASDEVKARENIALVNQSVARRSVRGLELQRERA